MGVGGTRGPLVDSPENCDCGAIKTVVMLQKLHA